MCLANRLLRLMTAPPSRMHDVDTYRIEKHRLAIAVRVRGGVVLDGFVFAQIATDGGHEDAEHILNGPDEYFPLVSASGGTLLVAKNRVLEAVPEVPPEIEESRRTLAPRAEVELTLEDGSRRRGGIYIELPHERPRVLDFLNFAGARFVALYSGGGLSLINRQAIACVHPLD